MGKERERGKMEGKGGKETAKMKKGKINGVEGNGRMEEEEGRKKDGSW